MFSGVLSKELSSHIMVWEGIIFAVYVFKIRKGGIFLGFSDFGGDKGQITVRVDVAAGGGGGGGNQFLTKIRKYRFLIRGLRCQSPRAGTLFSLPNMGILSEWVLWESTTKLV